MDEFEVNISLGKAHWPKVILGATSRDMAKIQAEAIRERFNQPGFEVILTCWNRTGKFVSF